MNRIDQVLRDAVSALAALSDSNPRLEAELLLSEATGWSRAHLLAWPERALDPVIAATFETLLARRLGGEPIAYIRGYQSFWTLELRVTPATLIPRPETELLVETALERLDGSVMLHIVDPGTGSGAIAAALASERPDWQLIATDRCPAALGVARDNFRRLGLQRIHTLQMHWLAAVAPHCLDAVVSNPPYIPAGDLHLTRGDLRCEPRQALTPGSDGLAAIRDLAQGAHRCLRPGGLLMVEHGYDQGGGVREVFHARGFRAVETRQDLAGLERMTLGYAS